MSSSRLPGALVVSLDFELHWGMRDHVKPGDRSFTELEPSRQVVRDLASYFARHRLRATWATVGMLFASTRGELIRCHPELRPAYRAPGLDPYVQVVGEDEVADPEHFAGSLVRLLADTPGQEVASHTYSHFYCLEEGQDEASFRADLAAARAIAALRGVELTSLVLPRNQWNPAYAAALLDHGFTCYRGPQPSWGHQARRNDEQRISDRVARLVGTYAGFSPPPTFAWDDLHDGSGLCNVPASAFLRPYDPRRRSLEPMRRARLVAGMRDAARRQRIFHLWWHPHNFVSHPNESFALLDALVEEFERLASVEGFRSMAMADVAAESWLSGAARSEPRSV